MNIIEQIKYFLSYPVLKEIIIFVILQIITYLFIKKKVLFKQDINTLIIKIENKVNLPKIYFMPKISKSTTKRIKRKDKELLKDIETFLKSTSITSKCAIEKSNSFINRIYKI